MKVTFNVLIRKVYDKVTQDILTQIRDLLDEIITILQGSGSVIGLVADVAGLLAPKPSCRAYNNAALVIANATVTALTLNSTRNDTYAIHDPTNTARLNVGKFPGIWSVGGNIAWDTSVAGTLRVLSIRINAGVAIAGVRQAPTGDLARQNVNCIYKFAAGDYIELIVNQDSGGNLNVLTQTNLSPEFWAFRVGD